MPYQYHSLRFWRNTAVAKLASGQTLTLAPGTGTLGYEWDVEPDNGFRPAGEFELSSTTVSRLQTFTDYGSTVVGPGAGGGTETHHLTLYKAPSGALVFGAGTVQWSWGLDNTNAWENFITDPSGNPPDKNIEQATVNLFADMGAQPASLISGLTAATASTDTTPPTLDDHLAHQRLDGSGRQHRDHLGHRDRHRRRGGRRRGLDRRRHDLALRQHDRSGGGERQLDLQLDRARNAPSTKIMSRAIDDSGNIETPSAGVTVNVGCPCSIWATRRPPDAGLRRRQRRRGRDEVHSPTPTAPSPASASTSRRPTPAPTSASLWNASGQLLAQVTFTGETASGWQNATFSSPVTIVPNTTYVVGYFAPNGHYSATRGGSIQRPRPRPPAAATTTARRCTPCRNNTSANGLFAYTSSLGVPDEHLPGQQLLGRPGLRADARLRARSPTSSATAGFNSANVSWTAPSTGGAPTSYIDDPVHRLDRPDADDRERHPARTNATVTGLAQGTAYTFTVQAVNPAGNGTVSAASNSVTPSGPQAPAAPTDVSANPASGQAQRQLDDAATTAAAPITGYTITPYIGSTAQTSVPVLSGSATSAAVTGLTNGTAYTFTVTATNNIGTGAGVGAIQPRSRPQDTIFDFAHAADDRLRRHLVGRARGQVHRGQQRHGDRHPLLQGGGQHRHPHRQPVDLDRRRCWRRPRSPTRPRPAGSTVTFASPVAVTAGTTYVAGYFAPQGHYSVQRRPRSTTAVDNAPLHALSQRDQPNGVYAYSAAARSPPTPSTPPTTGST